MKAISRDDLPPLFTKIDQALAKQNHKIHVTVLGGLAIIAQDFRSRATNDIDIAHTSDAHLFEQTCKKLSIHVDIVTVASTVDFNHIKTETIFTGKHLVVGAVTAPDLIRLKLERFQKHDEDDIYAILQKTKMPYDEFKNIVLDMLQYYVGNPRTLALSAQIVVDRHFPEMSQNFEEIRVAAFA